MQLGVGDVLALATKSVWWAYERDLARACSPSAAPTALETLVVDAANQERDDATALVLAYF
jgi:hypothetical protein